MSQVPDYKSTVRLPQTEFPMKGNLPQKEPEILRFWNDSKIYQRMLEKNRGRARFSLPDGPPYANGSIHMGHALNKTLKDIIIKYKNLRGFEAPYIPGWDCHGLPIEHKVMKDLADKKITKTNEEILALCRAEASKWIEQQREQFRRLGVLGDWDHPYITMSREYEAEEVREFARAFKAGLIYRGEKPVYWDWTIQTALADAEVEYHDHKSPTVYVRFDITDPATLAKLGNPAKPVGLVIWTTTPWTLPANVGIALHPDFEYGVFDAGATAVVIATSLKESFEKETGLKLSAPSATFKGSHLERGKARHPWIDRDSIIVLGDHVTQDAGTGAVHTAPGHGADDFKVGQKYGLPVINPVDDRGAFTDEVPDYKGLNIFKANPLIIERLKQSGHLLAHRDIVHSYPHCWRTKAPLIFRTTPQWFLGLDLEGSQIRARTLKALDEVKFFPDWGEARFRAMMENRPDWCLSRQRIWGVPIPILICQETGEPLADADIMMRAADVIEKGGIEAYWNTPADELAGPGHAKGAFGSKGFKHGRDILDVWFDSGVCHAAVQKKRGLGFPADIYLEGSDQHRGWFNTSMLSSMATNGEKPFRALLTHGFVTDAQGRKMSKSLGNVVDPNEVSTKSGSEIVRLWAASEDYGGDVGCSKEGMERIAESYRKFRNTVRYLLGATNDFDPKRDLVPLSEMTTIDRWAMHEFAELVERVTEAYDRYEFLKVAQQLMLFFNVFLSSTYLDILKDRLYTWKADGRPRRSSQSAMFLITDGVLKMMSPILSFLAEEAWGHFKGKSADSVFLTEWPAVGADWKNPAIKAHFEEMLKARVETQKVLEALRNQKVIGSSLEASVVIFAEGETLTQLRRAENLREFLIVSKVEVREGTLRVEAAKAPGEKCVRCWTYSEKIGSDARFPAVCEKCAEALA